jgi:hypothetical protein
MNRTLKLLGALAAFGLMSGTVWAAEQTHHDTRYHMDHTYPARGYTVRALPSGHVPVYDRARNPYYFHGGVWYRPSGGRFVVVGPPIGVFVPVLPAFYTTVWFGGFPYYYANDTYYNWIPAQGQYEVVDPPEGADNAANDNTPGDAVVSTEPPAAAGEMYTYPKNGQTAEQQEQDRYECHRWAADQSGFDPTQNVGGGAAPDAARRSQYQHAMTACLEGRGYSVK